MGMLSLNSVVSYEARPGDLWTLEIEGLNLLDNKVVPATNVSYKYQELNAETLEPVPGLPIQMYASIQRVKQIDVTIVESVDLAFEKAILRWIDELGISKWNALTLNDIEKYSKKVTITEYGVDAKTAIQTRIFYILPPTAGVDKQHSSGPDVITQQYSFPVTGELTK